MKLLLDTHVFLWFVSGDPRIERRFIDAIRSSENQPYLSVASLWEAVVKNRSGKLTLPSVPEIYLPHQRRLHRINALPLDEQSVFVLPSLPMIHRDPFDRMMICQAIAHEMTILTVDPVIHQYAATCL